MKVRWIPKEERIQVPKPVIVSTEYDALYFGETKYIKAKLREITGESHMVSLKEYCPSPYEDYPFERHLIIDGFLQVFENDVLLVRTDIYSDGSKKYPMFKISRTQFERSYEITIEDDNENIVVAKRNELIERLKLEGRQTEIKAELAKLMLTLESDGTMERQRLANLVENKRAKRKRDMEIEKHREYYQGIR